MVGDARRNDGPSPQRGRSRAGGPGLAELAAGPSRSAAAMPRPRPGSASRERGRAGAAARVMPATQGADAAVAAGAELAPSGASLSRNDGDDRRSAAKRSGSRIQLFLQPAGDH